MKRLVTKMLKIALAAAFLKAEITVAIYYVFVRTTLDDYD